MVSELNSLVNQMHDQQDLQIEIIGHTNTRPPHPYCDQLSMKRINEIQSYLTDNGIEANRLKLIPMGKRYPMYTEDRQAENQRVEVIFRNK